jgi:beta-RFAP synthase
MIRVVAPSRLHFGLFHVPAGGLHDPARPAFGGVGLMIDTPGLAVTVRPAPDWRFEGPLASRAQQFAMRYTQAQPQAGRFAVLVEHCPAEHTGLGVGTQLGLAVAKALAVANGHPDTPAVELAAMVGRGERSAIGVHGFDRGGLIVEAGKRPGEDVSPLVERVELPASWRVVLLVPPGTNHWHGDRERVAFARATGGDPEGLRRLAEKGILPAARSGDLDAFGEAAHEFNRKAGEPFAAAQGGPYSSPAVEELIAELRRSGVRGVGQSSWGPTVFAVVADGDSALSLALRFRGRARVLVGRVSGGRRVENR